MGILAGTVLVFGFFAWIAKGAVKSIELGGFDRPILHGLCTFANVGRAVIRAYADDDPTRFEAGVEIFPGCVIEGAESLFGAGTKLGKAGGGYFRNVRAGRGCDLYGGAYDDCVLLDGVTGGHNLVKSHADLSLIWSSLT